MYGQMDLLSYNQSMDQKISYELSNGERYKWFIISTSKKFNENEDKIGSTKNFKS
jgi:hypothetical protein